MGSGARLPEIEALPIASCSTMLVMSTVSQLLLPSLYRKGTGVLKIISQIHLPGGLQFHPANGRLKSKKRMEGIFPFFELQWPQDTLCSSTLAPGVGVGGLLKAAGFLQSR